jgi:hypothetical protein
MDHRAPGAPPVDLSPRTRRGHSYAALSHSASHSHAPGAGAANGHPGGSFTQGGGGILAGPGGAMTLPRIRTEAAAAEPGSASGTAASGTAASGTRDSGDAGASAGATAAALAAENTELRRRLAMMEKLAHTQAQAASAAQRAAARLEKELLAAGGDARAKPAARAITDAAADSNEREASPQNGSPRIAGRRSAEQKRREAGPGEVSGRRLPRQMSMWTGAGDTVATGGGTGGGDSGESGTDDGDDVVGADIGSSDGDAQSPAQSALFPGISTTELPSIGSTTGLIHGSFGPLRSRPMSPTALGDGSGGEDGDDQVVDENDG